MPANPTTKSTLELNAVDNVTAVVKQVKSSVGDLSKEYDKLKGVLLGLSGTIGTYYFASMIRSTIEAEAALLRLSERTGNTVEELSSLTKVAKLANTDMDEVGKGMQKLAKAMAEAESGTGKAGKVFDALGIAVRDSSGQMRPTSQVMQELGQKLSAMGDQTLAVAFAQEVLGKSGANLLPFLYELARAGELQVKVTTEQAKQAKAFEDNLVQLKSASMDFWRHLANDMLPTMNKFLGQLIAGRDIAGGWMEAMRLFGVGMKPIPAGQEGARIQEYQARIDALQAQQGRTGPFGAFGPVSRGGIDNSDYISDLRKKIEFAKFLQRQGALDRAAGMGFTGDARDLALAGSGRTNVKNPFAGEGGGAEGSLLWTPQMEEMFQARKAAWIESEKISAEDEKILRDLVAAGEKYNASLEARADRYRDLLDPGRQFIKDQEKVNELVGAGMLTEEEGVQVQRKLLEARTKVEDLGKSADITAESAHAIGLSFASAMDKVVFDSQRGLNALDLLRAMALDVAKIIFARGVSDPLATAVQGSLMGLFSGGGGSSIGTGATAETVGFLPWAKGGVFAGGRIVPFANGGIVGGPTLFPMADGMGLMGEAGPEAVMPLTRAADGKLGVKAQGGGGNTFVIDARGADRTGLAQLARQIAALDGSIEYRAVAATSKAAARRGRSTPW